LRSQGHDVVRLTRPSASGKRPESSANEQQVVQWDPSAGALGSAAESADAVVHLAGASIAGGRWTPTRKAILRDSRVAATRQLVTALSKLQRPPSVFIAASAIGFYGDRGDETLTETSAPGADFLAETCQGWESEAARARDFGARVVSLRFGVVLAKQGGALPQMVLPFRFGAGGRIGSGKQWISWVALEDAVAAICYALANNLNGPANVVSPHPARNSEFAAAIGRVLHKPAILPTPGFALRLALGEMADALLLSSQRVLPEKLEQMGFRFAHPDLLPALQAVLG
jgi:uncharacterized protein (TIGR01777 family)